jgi:hypothetical protein
MAPRNQGIGRVANYHKRLRSKALVVSVMEKAWHDHVKYVFDETSASESPLKHRKN